VIVAGSAFTLLKKGFIIGQPGFLLDSSYLVIAQGVPAD